MYDFIGILNNDRMFAWTMMTIIPNVSDRLIEKFENSEEPELLYKCRHSMILTSDLFCFIKNKMNFTETVQTHGLFVPKDFTFVKILE